MPNLLHPPVTLGKVACRQLTPAAPLVQLQVYVVRVMHLENLGFNSSWVLCMLAQAAALPAASPAQISCVVCRWTRPSRSSRT